ncbi:hypothetical protein [Glutamicibacter sp. 2E12]|uniref:hypothetical protein n=1 Tax=Glutamicibacter sp. 2E12 TaxID=3416181 RepID=UPI003CEF99AF
MENNSPITGSVAQIASSTELIINRGSDHGVEEGMYFRVLDDQVKAITDPESKEESGAVRHVKVAVQVVEVAPKMSLARTFKTVSVNVGGTGPDVSSLMGFAKAPKYVQELERIVPEYDENLLDSPKASKIAIGDEVQEAANREDALRTLVFDM